MSQLPFRPNVCMLVYKRQEGRLWIWIGQRYGADTWQFPQGGVESHLSLEENARKELREELGLKKRHIGSLRMLEAINEYEFLSAPKRWKGKYRGQSQRFWAVEFVGDDPDIDLESDEHPEFSAWAWCPAEEVLDRVEPLRRPGYAKAVHELLASL